jgi:hypothetical protein
MCILQSILAIAFTSAMIQTIRTRKLIQKWIECQTEKFYSKVHIQDMVDSVLSPTYNRVAPIAQFVLGKNQFFEEDNVKASHFQNVFASLLYIVFKVITFIFLYCIPLFCIFKCWQNINLNYIGGTIDVPKFLVLSLMGCAIISIAILIIADLLFLYSAIEKVFMKSLNKKK